MRWAWGICEGISLSYSKYVTNDINTNGEYYTALYDDIMIPNELADIHPKAAIKARNRWMIDSSDIVFVYTIRNYGGAYEAKRYSEQNEKEIIFI